MSPSPRGPRPTSFASRALLLAAVALPAGVGAQAPPDRAVPPEPDATRVRLVVRADDIGITHESNAAMEQGFSSGLVTSASVMPVGAWFAETADLVRSHPGWSIGLHLTVSSEWDRLRWGPLASREKVPGLLAADGNFHHSYPRSPLALEFLERPPYLFGDDEEMPPPILARRRELTASRPPPADEVEAELRAQIEHARRNGIRIDYLDCHMGVACQPHLAPVLIRLAEELCVPIPERDWMEFENLRMPRGAEALAEMLGSLEPGLYRIVLHPVVDSPESRARDRYFGAKWARSGQEALDVLSAEAVHAAIARHEIELVSVRDLWDYGSCRMRPS